VLEYELLRGAAPPVEQHLSTIVAVAAVVVASPIFAHIAAAGATVFGAPFIK